MPPGLAVIMHFDVSRIEPLVNPVKLLGWAELGVATVFWQTTPTRKSLDGAPLVCGVGSSQNILPDRAMGVVGVQGKTRLS